MIVFFVTRKQSHLEVTAVFIMTSIARECLVVAVKIARAKYNIAEGQVTKCFLSLPAATERNITRSDWLKNNAKHYFFFHE